MKIACCGIAHESNTFTPLLTGLDGFRIRRGTEIDDPILDEFAGVEWTRILTASSTPSGPVRIDTYSTLKDEIIRGLKSALPVDGVYMPLHGAMEVDQLGDGESDLVSAIREVVGNDVPIAASLDLHGNVVPALCEQADILHAYRTAPHRDQDQTRRRTIELLIHCIKEKRRPAMAYVRVPLLLPGEKAITEVEPGKQLYARLPDIDAIDGVWTSSLMCGFAWADVPGAAMSVFVHADDANIARREAIALAEAVWEHRRDFGFDVETDTIEGSISSALTAPESTVFITDSGDNPTAGGAGDVPLFLESLIGRSADNALVAGLSDAVAVAKCVSAGNDAHVPLSLGGKLDSNFRPYEVEALVKHISDDEREVVVGIGGVTLVLSDNRRAYTRLQQFEHLDLDPLAFKVVVIKLGYLFPELRGIAPRHIMALSPGYSSEVIEDLPFTHVQRPIYPLDLNFEFNAEEACITFKKDKS